MSPLKTERRYNMANKTTSSKVATKASKILKDGRYGEASKSVAGSALSQAKKSKWLIIMF